MLLKLPILPALSIASVLSAFALVPSGSAQDSPEVEVEVEVEVEKIGALAGLSGAEISAYDPASGKLFITSGDGLEVIDLSDPGNPSAGTLIDPAADGASASDVTSVAVHGGVVAAAVPGDDEQRPGEVYFYNAATGAFLTSATAGALPDMVTFSPDGAKVLVANEGEPGGSGATPFAGGYQLEITEIWSGQDGTDLTEDWFEITNRGDAAWVSGADPDLYYDDESADAGTADPISGITQLDPGESAIVVVGENASDTTDFFDVWDPDKSLTGVEIGLVDGSGLGAGGDAVALWVGDPTSDGVLEDFAAYPGGVDSGVSWDVNLFEPSFDGNSSGAVTTTDTAGDSGTEPAIGSPGEASDTLADPRGSVSIIAVSGGVGAFSVDGVTSVEFIEHDGSEDDLRAEGARIWPGRSASKDIEPEYIAVTLDGATAYVSLQENNALAEIDLSTDTLVGIIGLGFKDHMLPGNEIDSSDDDGVLDLQNRPVFGMLMPDAIATFAASGQNYVITANEGDARDEDERIKNVTLDPAAFPEAATLQQDAEMGRLQISTVDGDFDGDGDFDELYSYGARSFSIFDSAGAMVHDSGAELAQVADDAGIYPDGRSDNKGSEPEGVTTGVVGSTTLAFIGLERADAVAVYDVTVPASPVFKALAFDIPADEDPEGLTFIAGADSPNGEPLLVITSEATNTLSVYAVSVEETAPPAGDPRPDLTFRKRGKKGPVVGEDFYSRNGRRQMLKLRERRKVSVIKFSLENEGTESADFKLKAFKLPKRKFDILYKRVGEGNVTAQLTTGRRMLALDGIEKARFVAKVRRLDSRKRVAKFSKKIKAQGRPPGLRDVMGVKVKFR